MKKENLNRDATFEDIKPMLIELTIEAMSKSKGKTKNQRIKIADELLETINNFMAMILMGIISVEENEENNSSLTFDLEKPEKPTD